MGAHLFACGYPGDPTTEPLQELTAVAAPEDIEKFYAGTKSIDLLTNHVYHVLALRSLTEYGVVTSAR